MSSANWEEGEAEGKLQRRLLATSCWEAALGLVLSTTGPAGAGGVGEGRNFLITQVTGKGWWGEEGIKVNLRCKFEIIHLWIWIILSHTQTGYKQILWCLGMTAP